MQMATQPSTGNCNDESVLTLLVGSPYVRGEPSSPSVLWKKVQRQGRHGQVCRKGVRRVGEPFPGGKAGPLDFLLGSHSADPMSLATLGTRGNPQGCSVEDPLGTERI